MKISLLNIANIIVTKTEIVHDLFATMFSKIVSCNCVKIGLLVGKG